MPYLLLDTAAEIGIAALMEGEHPLVETMLPNTLQGSRTLLPEIIALFEKTGLKPEQLDFVATGVGPGSYTGIRVSVITAKAFAYPHALPLVGVCSLEAYVPDQLGEFTILADAKIGGIYMLRGHVQEKEVILDEPLLVPVEQVSENKSLFITPKGGRLPQRLPHLQWIETLPSVVALGRAAWKKFQKKDFSTNTQLEILYLRKTQAEIEKGK